jgi:hypothetical protein
MGRQVVNKDFGATSEGIQPEASEGLVAVNKDGHRPTHLRHASLKSWLDYTNDLYSQGYHGFSSAVHFPFPSQDTDEDGSTSDR